MLLLPFSCCLNIPSMSIQIRIRQHILNVFVSQVLKKMVFEWLTSSVFFQASHKSPFFHRAFPITSNGHSYPFFLFTTDTRDWNIFSHWHAGDKYLCLFHLAGWRNMTWKGDLFTNGLVLSLRVGFRACALREATRSVFPGKFLWYLTCLC